MFLQDLSALGSVECCELGCVNTQKHIEWSKMNEDSGAVTTFPLSFGPEGNGYDRVYCTASGECPPDGGCSMCYANAMIWMTHVLQNGHIMALRYHILQPFCPHVQTTDWCFDSIVVGVCAVGTFWDAIFAFSPTTPL